MNYGKVAEIVMVKLKLKNDLRFYIKNLLLISWWKFLDTKRSWLPEDIAEVSNKMDRIPVQKYFKVKERTHILKQNYLLV
jgi:hypothetical protein